MSGGRTSSASAGRRVAAVAVRRLAEPARFAMVGAFNSVLDVGLFAILVHGAGVPAPLANLITHGTAITSSYALNRYWTFAARRGAASGRQFALFFALNLVALGISTVIVLLAEEAIGAVPAKLLSLIATFAWNYTTSRLFVFRHTASESPT